MKRLIPSILVLILSAGVNAETIDEKLLKLQAANDALTERVAELLQENRRLQKAVQDALQAQQSGSKIVSGCDVESYARVIAFSSDNSITQERKSMEWLRKSGATCTAAQLDQLLKPTATMTYSSAPTNLINYFKSVR